MEEECLGTPEASQQHSAKPTSPSKDLPWHKRAQGMYYYRTEEMVGGMVVGSPTLLPWQPQAILETAFLPRTVLEKPPIGGAFRVYCFWSGPWNSNMYVW